MSGVREIFNTFLDLVYPRICYMCGEKISDSDKYFCPECYNLLKNFEHGANIMNTGGKQSFQQIIDDIDSLFHFEPETISQKIIHLIKYEGMKNLGFLMGKRLGKKLKRDNVSADLIIPVPLHLSKKRERGYNQSEAIAGGVASELEIPIETKIIKRNRFTKSQTKLNREERIANVKEAFGINNYCDLTGKTVFILDDVITSGATVAGCAGPVKSMNAAKVIALSLAYVDDNHDILKINT